MNQSLDLCALRDSEHDKVFSQQQQIWIDLNLNRRGRRSGASTHDTDLERRSHTVIRISLITVAAQQSHMRPYQMEGARSWHPYQSAVCVKLTEYSIFTIRHSNTFRIYVRLCPSVTVGNVAYFDRPGNYERIGIGPFPITR